MPRLTAGLVVMVLALAAQAAPSYADSRGSSQAASSPNNSEIVVPAGTTVSLALTSPILAKTARTGAGVYAVTVFPVAVNNQMAIPAGTYVQGQIDAMTRPGWLSPHAQFQMHFTKLIFANGYTVEFPNTQPAGLPGPGTQASDASTESTVAAKPHGPPPDVLAAIANPYVDVSSASDVLLDNGTQLDMILQVPLRLDAQTVAAAVRMTNAVAPGPFKSATLCRPTPGIPGTPDTVIPGTPGTPGTPDTVIPGGPGMPDTVIPGTPATPGTPDTVIPGTSGTPGTVCPGPPIVTTNPKAQSYKGSFEIAAPVQLAGTTLAAGTYQASWQGMGPTAQVDILQDSKVIVRAEARVLQLNSGPTANEPGMRTNADGSVSLRLLRFAGQTLALYFEPSSGSVHESVQK